MTADRPPQPSVRRFQFSLRLLLLAFTAFAIGFPLWYRWPYEEVETNKAGTSQMITTWQRQFGGGKLKHGLQRQIAKGKTIESLTYRHGLRHGLYESPQARGQFVNDLREGVWTSPDRTMNWQHGKLHGPAEIRLPPEVLHPSAKWRRSQESRKFSLMFSEGRLTEFNGQPASNRLFELLDSDDLDERTRNELQKSTMVDVVQMPLKDTMMYLSDLHAIPFILDTKLGKRIDTPLTGEFLGIDLCSALLLLTAPQGLGADYRYGCLWITTAEDGADWRDPTGVAEINPKAGSDLHRVWNEAAPTYDAVATPLADVLAYIQQPLAIDIDVSRIKMLGENAPLVTGNLRGLPLRHVLGQLLYQTNCRCRLEGDKLVILPPEEKPATPSSSPQ